LNSATDLHRCARLGDEKLGSGEAEKMRSEEKKRK
jgi:hypothetical protein